MKQNWTDEDLYTDWLILPDDQKIIGKKRGATRLGFAILLKFFQLEGRFPSSPHEIPREIVKFVALQIGVEPEGWEKHRSGSRSADYHRAAIRKHLGYKQTTIAHVEPLKTWLINEVLDNEYRLDRLREAFLERCQNLHIEPPTDGRMRRLFGAALNEHEKRFGSKTYKNLD